MKTLLNKTFLLSLAMVISIAFSGFAVESMFINSSGNVGIGTNTPSVKLDVAGRFVITGTAENLDPASTTGNISFLKNSAKLLVGWNRLAGWAEYDFIANRASDTHVGGFRFIDYSNAGVEKTLVYMQGNNGNVGIGTISPRTKLEIAGDLNVQGKIFGRIYSTTVTNLFDNKYFLQMQDDGNLVVYRTSDSKPIWSSMGGITGN